MKRPDIDTYLTFPALAYLVVTLVSGMWIRVQWVEPSWAVFNPKFAIHAHSHLAMLGWLFPIFLRLFLPKNEMFSTAQKTSFWVLHGLIIAMFPAFLLEGYAFWSITLSSLYLVVSYGIIYLFRRHLFLRKQPLIGLAVGFYLISTIGPWALGGATAFGPQWLSAWIAWFLHLQFNGWVTFAVFALLMKRVELHQTEKNVFYGVALATLFLSFGMMFPLTSNLLFGVVTGAGITLVFSSIYLGFHILHKSSKQSYFAFFALLLLAKTFFIGFISADVVQVYVHEITQSRVAFTHTLLLGIATPFTLKLISNSVTRLLIFISSAWVMILFLWIETFHIYTSLGFNFSIQWIYIFCGFLLLISLFGLISSKKHLLNFTFK